MHIQLTILIFITLIHITYSVNTPASSSSHSNKKRIVADSKLINMGDYKVHEEANAMTVKKYLEVERAPPTQLHVIKIDVQDNNMDQLTERLHELSDPSSSSYGKHMSKEEIDALTLNTAGINNIRNFIDANISNVTILDQNDHFFRISASIEDLENALKTKFYIFKNIKTDALLPHPRCYQYSLPSSISKDVSRIDNTTQFPTEMHHGPIVMKKDATK